MRKGSIATLASIAAVLGFATSALAGPATAAQKSVPSGVSTGAATSDSDTNRALDYLARKLAVAVSSVEIRETLHEAIAKRFDGDTNVLWKSLVEGSDFNAKVAAVANAGTVNSEKDEQIASEARKFPRLQVAVPELFDSWAPGEYAPLVAFVPEGVDDTELTSVTAYDAQGSAILLDAKVAPKKPVIILGLNERTDENGQLRSTQPTTKPSGTTEVAALAAARTSYQVGMVIVHLIHDMEPWVKGAAEIAHAARSRGCSGVNYEDYDWVHLNNDGDWWAPGTRRVLGHTTCPVVFVWWEDDGGAWDFELKYESFGFGIGMDDDDDMIGKVQLPYSSFQGASMEKYDGWSNLEMWTD